ncbi:GNAT family protein, partial [Avibacterium paragallinarum]
MPSISPIAEQDFDALFEIEKAAHSIPWSLRTLKNNQGNNYFNLKLVWEGKIIGFAICQKVYD